MTRRIVAAPATGVRWLRRLFGVLRRGETRAHVFKKVRDRHLLITLAIAVATFGRLRTVTRLQITRWYSGGVW